MWENVKLRLSVQISGILARIHDVKGGLPGGRSPSIDTDVEVFMDFAQEVANNDELWASLPKRIVPSEAFIIRAAQMRAGAYAASDDKQSYEKILEALRDEYRRGVDRDELRDKLDRLLDECR